MKFKFPNYLTIGRIIIVPIFVFAFAKLDTGSLILHPAKNSLKPEINISLVKIIIAEITS